jgi:chromosome segregation ATPase
VICAAGIFAAALIPKQIITHTTALEPGTTESAQGNGKEQHEEAKAGKTQEIDDVSKKPAATEATRENDGKKEEQTKPESVQNIDGMLKKLDELQRTLDASRGDPKALKKECEAIKADLVTLKSTVTIADATLAGFQERVRLLQLRVLAYRADQPRTREDLKELLKKLDDVEEKK